MDQEIIQYDKKVMAPTRTLKSDNISSEELNALECILSFPVICQNYRQIQNSSIHWSCNEEHGNERVNYEHGNGWCGRWKRKWICLTGPFFFVPLIKWLTKD